MGFRTRRWRSLLPLLIVPVLVAAGCGEDEQDSTEPSSGGTAGEERYLFVQSAGAGTLTPGDGSGAYRLELESVDPHVVYFSDRPERDAGRMATASFLSQVFEPTEADPNAALVTDAAGDGDLTLPFSLAEPSYDESAGTLSYLATPLDEAPEGLASFDQGSRDDIPRQLGRLELFIDSTSYHRCFGRLINGSSRTFTLASKDPDESDRWDGIANVQTLDPGENARYTFKFHSDASTQDADLELSASGTSTKLKTRLACDEMFGQGQPDVNNSSCSPDPSLKKKFSCTPEGHHGRTIYYELDD